jgi:glycine C-acetyltransferase
MTVDPIAENFNAEDFLKPGWEAIDAKLAFFAPYFQRMREQGGLMREAQSAASHRMRYTTPRSGPEPREVLMFGSNNYLGLANEPEVLEKTIAAIREFGIGCGGPPLLNGYTRLHRELEERLAAFKGCEAALVYSSGYAANVGWLSGLLGKKDVLLYDSLSHASLHDGIKMGAFKAIAFAHNDMEDLRKRLMEVRWEAPYTNIIVCVEGLYSMDGDYPPLGDVRALCDKYGALLAIDDAHSTGVLGDRGHGVQEMFGLTGKVDIVMGTFSKTFAVAGGFVAGSKDLIDFLRFHSRSYMFSASLPTPVVASVLAGLDFIDAHPERVTALRDNSRYMVAGLRRLGFDVQSETSIIPFLVPARVDLAQMLWRLHEEGVFVNAITFPAVPKARQRLRISMMATFSRADLDRALAAFAKVTAEFGMP